MRTLAVWLSCCLAVVFTSCGETITGADPDTSPATIFDIVWEEFDRYYALFDVRGVDWDSIRAAHRPRAVAAASERELFDELAAMLYTLNDAHVTLRSPFETIIADTSFDDSSAILDRELVFDRYLNRQATTLADGRMRAGMIGDSIGYIAIATFAGPIEIAPGYSRWAEDIEAALATMQGASGIIIDVRDNDGGNTFNALYIAGHFADTRRLYQSSRSRAGREHDELTEPFERYIEPAGNIRFGGRVAVLVNGRSISGAEWFTLAMRELPQVTIVGDTTAGNFSGRMERELPNGWTYSISVQRVVDARGVTYEGVGIPPDVIATTTRAHVAAGRDPVLEKGIESVR